MPTATLESDGVGGCSVTGAVDGITMSGALSAGVATCFISPSGLHLGSLESDGVATSVIMSTSGVVVGSLESDGIATSYIIGTPAVFSDVTLSDAQPMGLAIGFRGAAQIVAPPLVLL